MGLSSVSGGAGQRTSVRILGILSKSDLHSRHGRQPAEHFQRKASTGFPQGLKPYFETAEYGTAAEAAEKSRGT